ncbi:MAG: hypothetical protein QF362_00685 [Candidatus Woesearchaeota archaeon]|jgi:hypothetical protein|nr:hypothetical protein [Candidatus Woesearchaeota archaeon]MDP7505947.1 hypothetical protein [Candidatus Woesearchaeota archaeon]MDP7610227.1 hypothetical protein [Candidatus Woesearchaeota archaeon]|tara:strand:- start:14929 stop:15420 length:492 start_codon:yes stop_codon:yes gene_type:complete
MKPEEIYEKLEKSSEFKEWKKDNKGCFLSYMFKVTPGDEDWQVGFYDKGKDSITTFKFVNDKVEIIEDQKVFKKEESNVNKLELNDVKVELEEALKTANKVRSEKYKVDYSKIIVLLQRLDVGQIWNITYITNTLSTLNIKLSCDSGDVLSEELIPLTNYKGG